MKTERILQYLVIFVTLGLLLYSVFSTSIYSVEHTDLGLASRLPISYWIGLFLVGVLWFAARNNKYVMTIALAFTFAYLFVVPAVIVKPVWLSNSYYPFGESDLVTAKGNLESRLGPNQQQTLNSYISWPGFIYFASIFQQVTGISATLTLKYFPLLILSICSGLVYLILNLKLKTAYALYGTAFFLVTFWFRQQYFGPPGIGFIFFLLNLFIIFKLFFTDTTKKVTLSTLFFLVFAVTTFTHVLSSFMSVVVLVSVFIAQGFRPQRSRNQPTVLMLFSAGFFLFYNIFLTGAGRGGFFAQVIETFVGVLTSGIRLGLFSEPSRVTGSVAQLLNYRLTLAILAVTAVVAVIGLIAILRTKPWRKHWAFENHIVFWAVFLVFMGVFSVTVEYGPHEAYQRAFMFGSVAFSFFFVTVFSKRPKLLLIILTILFFLNIPAQYGSDSFTLSTQTHLSGSKFVAFYTPDNITCLYDFSLHIRYYNVTKILYFVTLGTQPYTAVPNAKTVANAVNESDYVILSETQKNYFYYYIQENPFSQENLKDSSILTDLNRVYDSSGFTVLGKK